MKTDSSYRDRIVRAVNDFQRQRPRKCPCPVRNHKRQTRHLGSFLKEK